MHIVQEGIDQLHEYEQVSIAFEIASRLTLPDLVAVPIEPRYKDYDAFVEERPTSLAKRYDLSEWGIFAAFEDEARVGGAIVACKTPAYELLENRHDLAVLADIRVAGTFRGQGAGTKLFETAKAWAKTQGCIEMRAETQDTNVPACRFYAALGGELISFESSAYEPALDEARLIWRFIL